MYIFPQGCGWRLSRGIGAMLSTLWTLLCMGYIISHHGRAWAHAAQALIKETVKSLAVGSLLIGGPLLTVSPVVPVGIFSFSSDVVLIFRFPGAWIQGVVNKPEP